MGFRLGVLAVLMVAGCAAPKPPTTQLIAAKAAIRGAVEAGARDAPKGRLHLKMARDHVGRAEDLISAEEMSEARHLLIRAEADGNLAISLAKQVVAERELAEIKDKLERLRKQQGGDS